MTDLVLYRAAADVEQSDGRTLIGRAFYFDHPSIVADPPRFVPYLEEFVTRSTDKTLKDRGEFPLFAMHDHKTPPLGIVRFRASAGELLYEAKLSRTRDADEKLELVNDLAMRSVSVGFRTIANGKRSGPDGPIVRRLEIALRELSLVPAGFGAHAGAEVLEVRGTPELELEEGKVATPRLAALRRRRLLL